MEEFITIAKKEIPSVDHIFDEALSRLSLDKPFVKNNFGKALILVDEKATKIYRSYERKALEKLAVLWLGLQKEEVRRRLRIVLDQEGWERFLKEAKEVFVEFGILVQELEKDLGNMRKARGGTTFEKMVLKLLGIIGIKAERPGRKAKERLGRIDIVIPSVEVASETPDRAIFLTCKRTLRERWKQEVPQARLNQRIYLLTIDDNLSESKAEEINEKEFIAFVRDDIVEKQAFQKMPWIRRLSDLPKELKKI